MADAVPTSNIGFQNFYQAQLTGDITASSTTINLDTVPTVSESFLVIEPDSATNREIIYYNSKTSIAVVCPDASTGRGQGGTTAVDHAQGSTVIMAPVAEYFETLLALFTTTPQGWTSLAGTFSVASGYNKGNKEYVIDTSADQSAILSPGMRFKIGRGTTPPTQCADFESSSSQYANRASGSVSGIIFTDDWTTEANIELESLPVATAFAIVCRGTTTNGFFMDVGLAGQLRIYGYNGGVYEGYETYQSIPLGRPVHVAATLDLSGNASTMYIDGVAVATKVISGGGALSAITQTGDLYIGRSGGTDYFDGLISDVRVWNTIRTATQIRDNMHQQLVGSESGLVAYFKLNGNFNDSTSNANNLTAQNGAVATATNPFMNSTEYGIIHKVTTSQITVFTGTDYVIPNGTLSNPFYSTQHVPYGFPADKDKWITEAVYFNSATTTASVSTLQHVAGGPRLDIGTGDWQVDMEVCAGGSRAAAGVLHVEGGLSSSTSAYSDPGQFKYGIYFTNTTAIIHTVNRSGRVSNTTPTTYYCIIRNPDGALTNIEHRSDVGGSRLVARSAYI